MNIDLDKYEIALVSDGTVRLSIYEDGRSKDHRYVTVESIHLAQDRIAELEALLSECDSELLEILLIAGAYSAHVGEIEIDLAGGGEIKQEIKRIGLSKLESLLARIDAALKGGPT